MFSEVLESEVRTGEVTVTELGVPPGRAGYLVRVVLPEGLAITFDVVDHVWGVRILDPGGEDVTVDEAVRYLRARLAGMAAGAALRSLDKPAQT